MEETTSVFWVDLGAAERVPLQSSRGVTDTLVMFFFLFILSMLYMLLDFVIHVTWLPCGRF